MAASRTWPLLPLGPLTGTRGRYLSSAADCTARPDRIWLAFACAPMFGSAEDTLVESTIDGTPALGGGRSRSKKIGEPEQSRARAEVLLALRERPGGCEHDASGGRELVRHAGFEVAGAGDGPQGTAPVLDPTEDRESARAHDPPLKLRHRLLPLQQSHRDFTAHRKDCVTLVFLAELRHGAQTVGFARAARSRTEVDSDVHVGAQAGGAVKDGGLRPEQEPADAERAEAAREVGEKVSDRLRRGRHRRRDRSHASTRCGGPDPPGAPPLSASQD